MGFFSYGQIVEQVATVSASGTTSLSSTSKQIQYLNGTSAQTIQLPATSGMTVGQFFEIYNVGTNSLTVQFADGTSFTPAPTVQTSGSLVVKLVNLTASSGTATNGIWAYSLSSENLSGNVTIGGNLTVNGTTSLAQSLAFSGQQAFGNPAANGQGYIGAYSTSLGLTLIGKGSTNDITILNDTGTTALSIPTGTTNVVVGGSLTVNGTTSSQEGFFTTGGPTQVALKASGSGTGGMGVVFRPLQLVRRGSE